MEIKKAPLTKTKTELEAQNRALPYQNLNLEKSGCLVSFQ